VKVTCIATRGEELPPPRDGSLYFRGTTLQNVTLGLVYDALAITVFVDDINVLIADDLGNPVWLPMAMFQVDDPQLPSDWEFAYFEGRLDPADALYGLRAIWGYPLIVQSPAHYVALAEGEPDAVKLFAAERARRS
jgi:hypothetical protein